MFCDNTRWLIGCQYLIIILRRYIFISMNTEINPLPREIVVEECLTSYFENVRKLGIASGLIFGADESTHTGYIRTVFNQDIVGIDTSALDALGELGDQLDRSLHGLVPANLDIAYVNPSRVDDLLREWDTRGIEYSHLIFEDDVVTFPSDGQSE